MNECEIIKENLKGIFTQIINIKRRHGEKEYWWNVNESGKKLKMMRKKKQKCQVDIFSPFVILSERHSRFFFFSFLIFLLSFIIHFVDFLSWLEDDPILLAFLFKNI